MAIFDQQSRELAERERVADGERVIVHERREGRVEDGPGDDVGADRARAVEDDDRQRRPGCGFEEGEQRGAVRVEADADVLQVHDDGVEVVESVGLDRPAPAEQAANGRAAPRVASVRDATFAVRVEAVLRRQDDRQRDVARLGEQLCRSAAVARSAGRIRQKRDALAG